MAGAHIASLTAHNALFTSLLHLIPPQFYLVQDQAEVQVVGKYLKNKRKKSKSEVEARERKDKIREHKKAKLDPDSFKTVSDLQAERALRADDDFAMEGADDFQAGDTDDDMVDSDTDDIAPVTAKEVQTEGERKASIQALRDRLHAKIQGLQKKRGGEAADDDNDSVVSSKDELLEERRRKRGEMRDRRRKERKEARRAATAAAQKPTTNKGAAMGTCKAPALLINQSQPNKKEETTSNVTFSSLKFSGGFEPTRKSRLALPSDPKSALLALEARKAKDAVKKSKLDSDGVASLEDKQKWDRALAAAEGVKIRDDEKLLKKAIKRKEKGKEKSSKAWLDRTTAEKEQQAARQKKRQENIAARKSGGDKKKESSTAQKGKGAKPFPKGKARPGFEGKGRK